MKTEKPSVCIICHDDRVAKWGHVLSQTDKFARIFLVRSHYDFQEILPGNIDASLLPEEKLPDTFDSIFFHSSNIDLWYSLSLKANYIFEFNTPGDPPEREGVISIMRQTAPYFGIKFQDIKELSNYITGVRKTLPLCCTDALQPEVLPSMICLFYLYYSRLEREEQNRNLSVWHEIWKKGSSGAVNFADSIMKHEWIRQLEREWKYEWQLVEPTRTTTAKSNSISGLIQASLADVTLVTEHLVDEAYIQLRNNLGLRTWDYNSEFKKPEPIKAIIALSNCAANYALAAVLSYLWDIPHHVMESSGKNLTKMKRDTLLVISESQINLLKHLRFLGFSGAVLVISTDPLRMLKQRHRVLRFGQGSHESFSAPWDFETLLPRLSELMPLAPENLQLLQREIEASSRVCRSHIEPCRVKLDSIDGSGKVADEDIEKLEETVIKIRADLPVACHAVVSVATKYGGQHKLQIQEHFQAALKKLRSGDMRKISCGVDQFKKVFTQLQHYVLEAW